MIEKIIRQVEDDGLQKAPSGVSDFVLEKIRRMRIVEYRIYCSKVIASVAASIAIIFSLSYFSKEYPVHSYLKGHKVCETIIKINKLIKF